jgi:hypothetical protein
MRRMFVKTLNPKGPVVEEVFYECLALLGICAMAGVLAVAMRLAVGKW